MSVQVGESNTNQSRRVNKLALVSLLCSLVSWFFPLAFFNQIIAFFPESNLLTIPIINNLTNRIFSSLGYYSVYFLDALSLSAVTFAFVALQVISKNQLAGRKIAEASLILGTWGSMIWMSVLLTRYSLLIIGAVFVTLFIIALIGLRGRRMAQLIMIVGTIPTAILAIFFFLLASLPT